MFSRFNVVEGRRRFSLTSLFAVIAVCSVFAFIARMILMRVDGRAAWNVVCMDAARDPLCLQERVDKFIEHGRRGWFVVPSRNSMVKEFRRHIGTYLISLRKLEPQEILDSIEQVQYMKSALNLIDEGTIDVRSSFSMDVVTAEIGFTSRKVVRALADEINLEQALEISPADDEQAKLNLLISDMALLKRRLPSLLRKSKDGRGKALSERPTWQQITRMGGVEKSIRRALVPVFRHDFELLLADDSTLSTRLSDSTRKAYQQRIETVEWLCECSEEEFFSMSIERGILAP